MPFLFQASYFDFAFVVVSNNCGTVMILKKNLSGRAGSWRKEVGHKWEGGGNLGRGWWGGGGGGDGQAGSQEEEELGVLTQSLLLSWVLGQPVRCPPMASWTQVFARSWSDAWENRSALSTFKWHFQTWSYSPPPLIQVIYFCSWLGTSQSCLSLNISWSIRS